MITSPCECVKDMGYEVQIQRRRGLLAVYPPVRVVHSINIVEDHRLLSLVEFESLGACGGS